MSGVDIPLQPRGCACPVPLTGSQRRYQRFVDESGGYSGRSIASAVRISGPLDVALLEESVRGLIHRHESLRMTVVSADGAPLLQVDGPANHSLEIIDLSGLAHAASEVEALRLARACSEEQVSLAAGPLFKARLMRLSRSDHLLAVAADHMIADGYSSEILNREIWKFYDEGARGVPSSLVPAAVQFPDYAVWQERTYPAWVARHAAYWQERLRNAPRMQLPSIHGFQAGTARTTATLHVPFGKQLSTDLRELAERERTPLPLLVLTIYACVMSRWCECRDLLLLLITHGRDSHDALKSMVGFLANCLHLRLSLGSETTFLELLGAVRSECEQAYQHYHFDRVWDFIPTCDSELCFNWIRPTATHGPARVPGTDSLRIRPFPLGMSWPGAFFAFFSDTPAGLQASVAYQPDKFPVETVQAFARSLRAMAHAAAHCPRNPVTKLPQVI